MQSKRGISLVTLVITIIVMIIIGTISIKGISNLLDKTQKEDFVNELQALQNKIKEYYLANGKLPVNKANQYTVSTLTSMIDNLEERSLLLDEITMNKDSSNVLYKVDIQTLDVKLSERGKEETDTDIFVVSTNSLNIYYVAGVTIDGQKCYSLVNLVTRDTVEKNVVDNNDEVDLATDIIVKKNTNTWTNNLKVKVEATLNSGETLKYYLLNNTNNMLDVNGEIVLNSSNLNNDEKSALTANGAQLTVAKIENNAVIQQSSILLDNFDAISPVINSIEITDGASAERNVIKINATDEKSGIKKIVYDYYMKKLSDGKNAYYYYEYPEITLDRLLNVSNKSIDGTMVLNKNIKNIKVAAIDNAGNVSDIVTYEIDDAYVIGK